MGYKISNQVSTIILGLSMILLGAFNLREISPPYTVDSIVLTVLYFPFVIFGFLFLVFRFKSIVTVVTIALVLDISTTFRMSLTYLMVDEVMDFTTAESLYLSGVLYLCISVVMTAFLVMYLFGMRHNAKRLKYALLAQMIVLALQVLLQAHVRYSLGPVLRENIILVLQSLMYISMVLLLSDRSVSDRPLLIRARSNADAMYSVMGAGNSMYISKRVFEVISNPDPSNWKESLDPTVESETVLNARCRYTTYGILLQKIVGSENIRMTIYSEESDTVLKALTIDIMSIVNKGHFYGCDKVRFYGKDGVFIDLLVGKPDLRIASHPPVSCRP